MIDGVDTNNIGLHVLRRAMTIIPQDPILLVGSLRFNVDPLTEYSDEEVTNTLKKSQVWDTLNIVVENPNDEAITKLNMLIEDGGQNLSVGQRQLICISRA